MLVLAALLLLSVPWWDLGRGLTRILTNGDPAWLLFLACAGILAATIFSGRRVLLLITFAAFSVLNMYLGTIGIVPAGAARDSYMRIAQGLKSIEKVRTPGHRVWFWFDAHEPYGREFDSLNSTWLWGYTWLSRDFPTLRSDLNGGAGESIVVPSRAGNVLGQARQGFLRKGLDLPLKAENQIRYGGDGYTLSILEVVPNPENVRPLALSLDRKTRLWRFSIPAGGEADPVLPLEKWMNDDRRESTSRIDHLPYGLQVTANTGGSKYDVIYGPLEVPVDGSYLFSLKIRQPSGPLRFGVLAGDKSRWLVETPRARVEGGNEYQDGSLHLAAGQQFWLTAATAAPPSVAPVNFVIQEVQAYQYRE